MMDTARQRRAQEVEAKYAADLRALRQTKEDDLRELDSRHRIIKNSYQNERISIKEDYSLKRLDITTRIDHLKDQRTILKQRLQGSADAEEIRVAENEFARITSELEKLRAQCISLDRQEHSAMADAEASFDNRCKENQAERREINKAYVANAEKLHEAYLQQVEQNRQQRESEEGGES